MWIECDVCIRGIENAISGSQRYPNAVARARFTAAIHGVAENYASLNLAVWRNNRSRVGNCFLRVTVIAFATSRVFRNARYTLSPISHTERRARHGKMPWIITKFAFFHSRAGENRIVMQSERAKNRIRVMQSRKAFFFARSITCVDTLKWKYAFCRVLLF